MGNPDFSTGTFNARSKFLWGGKGGGGGVTMTNVLSGVVVVGGGGGRGVIQAPILKQFEGADR